MSRVFGRKRGTSAQCTADGPVPAAQPTAVARSFSFGSQRPRKTSLLRRSLSWNLISRGALRVSNPPPIGPESVTILTPATVQRRTFSWTRRTNFSAKKDNDGPPTCTTDNNDRPSDEGPALCNTLREWLAARANLDTRILPNVLATLECDEIFELSDLLLLHQLPAFAQCMQHFSAVTARKIVDALDAEAARKIADALDAEEGLTNVSTKSEAKLPLGQVHVVVGELTAAAAVGCSTTMRGAAAPEGDDESKETQRLWLEKQLLADHEKASEPASVPASLRVHSPFSRTSLVSRESRVSFAEALPNATEDWGDDVTMPSPPPSVADDDMCSSSVLGRIRSLAESQAYIANNGKACSEAKGEAYCDRDSQGSPPAWLTDALELETSAIADKEVSSVVDGDAYSVADSEGPPPSWLMDAMARLPNRAPTIASTVASSEVDGCTYSIADNQGPPPEWLTDASAQLDRLQELEEAGCQSADEFEAHTTDDESQPSRAVISRSAATSRNTAGAHGGATKRQLRRLTDEVRELQLRRLENEVRELRLALSAPALGFASGAAATADLLPNSAPKAAPVVEETAVEPTAAAPKSSKKPRRRAADGEDAPRRRSADGEDLFARRARHMDAPDAARTGSRLMLVPGVPCMTAEVPLPGLPSMTAQVPAPAFTLAPEIGNLLPRHNAAAWREATALASNDDKDPLSSFMRMFGMK